MTRARRGHRPLIESQAYKLIQKLGGAKHFAEVAKAIGKPISVVSVHRWSYSREYGGTNGQIPNRMWPLVLEVAKAEGIFLTPQDFSPIFNKQENKRIIYE